MGAAPPRIVLLVSHDTGGVWVALDTRAPTAAPRPGARGTENPATAAATAACLGVAQEDRPEGPAIWVRLVRLLLVLEACIEAGKVAEEPSQPSHRIS